MIVVYLPYIAAGLVAALLLYGVSAITFGIGKTKKIYEPKKRTRLVNNIYAEHILLKTINEDLDSLPVYASVPWIGTRWYVKRDLKKLGIEEL